MKINEVLKGKVTAEEFAKKIVDYCIEEGAVLHTFKSTVIMFFNLAKNDYHIPELEWESFYKMASDILQEFEKHQPTIL